MRLYSRTREHLCAGSGEVYGKLWINSSTNIGLMTFQQTTLSMTSLPLFSVQKRHMAEL